MQFVNILSFCFSILGLYSLVCYLRFLIPRNVLHYVSVVLSEAEHLLDRAESTGVIPQPNGYRSMLTMYSTKLSFFSQGMVTSLDHHSYSNQFLRIRMESYLAPGILQQLRLAVQYGLTCELYTLSSRVVEIKVEIKVR